MIANNTFIIIRVGKCAIISGGTVKLLDRLGEAQLNAGENRQAISTIEGILLLHPPNESSYRQLINHLRQELV